MLDCFNTKEKGKEEARLLLHQLGKMGSTDFEKMPHMIITVIIEDIMCISCDRYKMVNKFEIIH